MSPRFFRGAKTALRAPITMPRDRNEFCAIHRGVRPRTNDCAKQRRLLRLGEPAFEAFHRLRRKRDFGDENNCRASAVERRADGLQINFVLPEPVTPWSKIGRAFSGASSACSTSFNACVCSSFRTRFDVAMNCSSPCGSRTQLLRAIRRDRALQRAQRLVIERGLPQELRRAYRLFQLRNRLQKFGLPRRASSQFFDSFGSMLRAGCTNNCFFQPTSARRITCGSILRITVSIGQQ
jgi:hypothetical protein